MIWHRKCELKELRIRNSIKTNWPWWVVRLLPLADGVWFLKIHLHITLWPLYITSVTPSSSAIHVHRKFDKQTNYRSERLTTCWSFPACRSCWHSSGSFARIVMWNKGLWFETKEGSTLSMFCFGLNSDPGIIPFTTSSFKLAVWHASPLSSSVCCSLISL